MVGDKTNTGCRPQPRVMFICPRRGFTTTSMSAHHPCTMIRCRGCERLPDFIGVHIECYHVFKRISGLAEAAAADYMWTLGAWRKPWFKGSIMYPKSEAMDLATLHTVAHAIGLPQLCDLPQELVNMIQAFCPQALIWRSAALAVLAKRVQMQDISKIEFRWIRSWTRGGPMVPTAVAPLPARVKITIDARGISEIERFDVPKEGQLATEHLRFIVEDEAKTGSYTVEFKVDPILSLQTFLTSFQNGLARLRLGSDPTPRVWDIPYPPSPETWKIQQFGNRPYLWRTVDLDKLRGLTFFFTTQFLVGLHPHRNEEESATGTFDRIMTHASDDVFWAYVPIAPKDQILALGVRKNDRGHCNILVSRMLASNGLD